MEYKKQLLRVSHNMFHGYEDPLQRQLQEHWPGFTVLFGLDELPASVYMLFTLFTHIITY